MRFSQRMGLSEVRTAIQIDSMDEPLRNNLWDIVDNSLPDDTEMRFSHKRESYMRLYRFFFQEPIDTMPTYTSYANKKVREFFMRESWDQAYDLLEFIGTDFLSSETRGDYFDMCNNTLEMHLAGFRFIDGQLAPISDETHVSAIEHALQTPLVGVRTHLSTSLGFLADRKSPEPRNSIKEAISAVEALCSTIVGNKTTLDKALKKLESAGVPLHPALVQGWGKLYGYTSDSGGIRHALLDDGEPSIDDAMYFLVSSSAFISLLTEKSARAGISLD